jgi:PAS domain S-box-containing protein
MHWKQFAEAILVSCSLVATSYAAFAYRAAASGYSPALLYAPVPVLLWAAVRFGPMGAASASAVVALVSIFSASSGYGPFSMHSPSQNVLAMQLFLAVVALPLLVLAIVLEERKKLSQSLRASEERYALAVSAGQVTVWEYDLETGIITFDDNLRQVLGFDCSELRTRQQWLDRTHPEDVDLILGGERFAIAEISRKDRAAESIRVPDVEYRMFHKGGSIRWLLTRSRVMRGNGPSFRVVGTTTDITERHRVEDELHLSQQKLRDNYDKIRELAAKLMTAHEDERKKISRELHDEVSQRLVALTLALHNFRRHGMPGDSACHFDEILENTAEVAEQVHQLSRQLHPAVLEYAGLTGALQSFCDESNKRLGISVEFAFGELPVKIPNEVALCVYRVSQEAIRNAAQHSGSKRFRIELEAKDHVLQLSIRDWGRGFDPSTVRRNGGLGLISMEERVRLLGGVFQLISIAGSGTEIRAEVPVRG